MTIQKNVASQKIHWLMVDATDFATPEPSITVTAKYWKDAGGLSTCSNTVSECTSGMYRITLAATETNAGVVSFQFTGTGCADQWLTFYPEDGYAAELDSILVDTKTTLQNQIASILVDTGTTLDDKIDSILVDTGTTVDDKIDSILAKTTSILTDTGTTVDDKVDSILAKSTSILTDTGTTIQNQVASILVDTGTTLENRTTSIVDQTSKIVSNVSNVISTLDNYLSEIDSALTLVLTDTADISNVHEHIDSILADTADMQPHIDSIIVDTGTTLENRTVSIVDQTSKIVSNVSNVISTLDNYLSEIDSAITLVLADTADISNIHGHIDSILTDTATTLENRTVSIVDQVSQILADTGTTLDNRTTSILVDTRQISNLGAGIQSAILSTLDGPITNYLSDLNSGLDIAADKITSILTDTGTTLENRTTSIVNQTSQIVSNVSNVISTLDNQLSEIDSALTLVLSDTADISNIHPHIDSILAKSTSILTDTGTTLDDKIDSILADTGGRRILKNTALSNFEFLMIDSTDHVTPKTGLGAGVTPTRSIDGAAFGACANAVAEVANGIYKIDLAAADLNGDVITLKFTAAGADTTYITIATQA